MEDKDTKIRKIHNGFLVTTVDNKEIFEKALVDALYQVSLDIIDHHELKISDNDETELTQRYDGLLNSVQVSDQNKAENGNLKFDLIQEKMVSKDSNIKVIKQKKINKLCFICNKSLRKNSNKTIKVDNEDKNICFICYKQKHKKKCKSCGKFIHGNHGHITTGDGDFHVLCYRLDHGENMIDYNFT